MLNVVKEQQNVPTLFFSLSLVEKRIRTAQKRTYRKETFREVDAGRGVGGRGEVKLPTVHQLVFDKTAAGFAFSSIFHVSVARRLAISKTALSAQIFSQRI